MMKCLMLAILIAVAVSSSVLADYYHEYQRSIEVVCKNYNVNFTDLIYLHDKCLRYDTPLRLQISPKHKGYGLFATRKIRKGELIFKEEPLFVFASQWFDATEEDFSDFMQKHIFPKMTGAEFAEFQTLADAFPDDDERPWLNRIVYSNVFNLNEHIGMFLKISRINHSCKPSIVFAFKDGLMHLYASRDLEANEEVHISYIDPLMTKADRQEKLMNEYGFLCDCEICSANLTVEEQKVHDKNRVKIGHIYNFNHSDEQPEKNIMHLEYLLDLAKEEGVADDFEVTGLIHYELLKSLTRIPDYFNRYRYNVTELGRQVIQSFSYVYESETIRGLFQERLPGLPEDLFQ